MMRLAQMNKLPAYNASLEALASPLTAASISRLEQKLRLAIEDPRPKTSVSDSVSVANVDPLDQTLVLNLVERDIVARYVPRGFNVICTRTATSITPELHW